MAELTCPPLGTGSIDMNALSKAAAKAKSEDEMAAALEAATTRADAPAEPAPAAPAETGGDA